MERGLKLVTTENVEPRQMRNCFRCGREFCRESSDRICPNCSRPRVKKPLSSMLTFREKQVVHLVCQAKLNKQIAYELHLTEGTIKEYLNRIFRKVGVGNRTELAVWALTAKDGTDSMMNLSTALDNSTAKSPPLCSVNALRTP
jgi:DNA-binding NarL/FixJ family response regulator